MCDFSSALDPLRLVFFKTRRPPRANADPRVLRRSLSAGPEIIHTHV